jgi:hypothetical protein
MAPEALAQAGSWPNSGRVQVRSRNPSITGIRARQLQLASQEARDAASGRGRFEWGDQECQAGYHERTGALVYIRV